MDYSSLVLTLSLLSIFAKVSQFHTFQSNTAVVLVLEVYVREILLLLSTVKRKRQQARAKISFLCVCS